MIYLATAWLTLVVLYVACRWHNKRRREAELRKWLEEWFEAKNQRT